MTAEIVVMNQMGVALAADSAVTLDFLSQNGLTRKIYNTTNKLFALSKYHPVGIMIFGNAGLLGTPWEIIIKKYRASIGKSSFSTIDEYAKDFVKYLKNFFPSIEQDRYFLSIVHDNFSIIKDEIDKQVNSIIEENGKVNVLEIRRIIKNVISQVQKNISTIPLAEGVPDDFVQELTDIHKDSISKAFKEIFEKLPITKKDRNKLCEIPASIAVREPFYTPDGSGVVIAGYGEREIFPSVLSMTIEGVVGGLVRYKTDNNFKIDYNNNATIHAFAQNEMVCTFMEGIDPRINKMLEGLLSNLLQEYPRILLDNVSLLDEQQKAKEVAELQEIGKNLFTEIRKDLLEYKRKEFVNPILSAVGALPKDELAIMAETLVNLTSFKRKVSMDSETVGGPIDVAVISKGDGFVWIKRKHYFTANLNHHFFANYFQDTEQTYEQQ